MSTEQTTVTTPKELIELDLDRLHEINQTVDEIETDIKWLTDEAFIKSGLAARHSALLKKLNKKRVLQQTVENQVKASVGLLGETVKGNHLMAVYCDGRVTWDTKQMLGYAVAHPKINQFKNVGKPSVAIREVKSNDEE